MLNGFLFDFFFLVCFVNQNAIPGTPSYEIVGRSLILLFFNDDQPRRLGLRLKEHVYNKLDLSYNQKFVDNNMTFARFELIVTVRKIYFYRMIIPKRSFLFYTILFSMIGTRKDMRIGNTESQTIEPCRFD